MKLQLSAPPRCAAVVFRRVRVLLGCAFLVAEAAAAAPVLLPAHGDFLINTTTHGSQATPHLAVSADGGFVVVWQDDRADGSSWGIFARVFDAFGNPVGDQFQVNTVSQGAQTFPVVALDSEGDFVVAWESADGSGQGVFARRFDRNGTALGDQFRVNTVTTDDQESPALAMDPAGNWVIVWEGHDQSGSFGDVYARRYDAKGVAQGGEIPINQATNGPQGSPAVAMDADGRFLVAWESLFAPGDNQNGVVARRFSRQGAPLGAELLVNTYTQHIQGTPAVAMRADGRSVIVWQSFGQDGSDHGVYGQRFSAAGAKQGPEFRANTFTEGIQNEPTVAMGEKGFLVAWRSFGQGGQSSGVHAQAFQPSGAASGSELRINDADFASRPTVVMDSQSEVVVAWQKSTDVFAEVFGPGFRQLPAGPFLESPEFPDFEFKVRITSGAGQELASRQETDCLAETLCISGAVPGRSELFVRIVGPKPNGKLWPNLVRFTTSNVDLWVRQKSTTRVRYYRLAAPGPGIDVLGGLFDRDGFLPMAAGGALGLLARPGGGDLRAPSLEPAGGPPPPPPPGPFLTTPSLPGFRFKVRLTSGGGQELPSRQESACLGETLCISGALPGRSELFVRIVGPKPNGHLWPNLVRFTTSRVEVWIQQVSTGQMRYYELPPADPASDRIDGLFDRTAFLP